MNPPISQSRAVLHLASMLMLTLALIWPADLRAEADVPDQYVLFGPTDSLREQIAYLRKTWPEHHAIAVIEAKEEPECNPFKRPDGGLTDQIYCLVRVQFTEFIDGITEDRPRIHYWRIAANEITNVIAGRRILTFLVTGRISDTYVCIVMMRATEENVIAVRAALQEIGG